MSDAKLARSLFERWASELMNKDRAWNKVKSNFDELFYDFKAHSIPFEAAEELIKEAVAKHLPTNSVAKFTYRSLGDREKDGKSFLEFLDAWKKGISDFAYQAFYTYYSADIDKEDQSEGEKKYGNMNMQEYILQRKYAESFPEVDLVAIREQREKTMAKLLEKEDDGDKSNR